MRISDWSSDVFSSDLIECWRSGQGQYVDTSLMEASLVHTYWPAAMALATGHSPGPMGSAHPVAAPYQAFPTQDGWLNIGAISKATWIGVSDVLAIPALLTDRKSVVSGKSVSVRVNLGG